MKKFSEETQDPLSQQPMNRNSSRAVRIHLSTSPSKKTRGKDEEEVPRAASCASASLQRGKHFPVASKDRSERAQCQAKRDGKNRQEGRESNRGHGGRKKSVQSATTCGGQRQWCPGRSEHIALSYVWPGRSRQSAARRLKGLSCLTEPSAFTTNLPRSVG